MENTGAVAFKASLNAILQGGAQNQSAGGAGKPGRQDIILVVDDNKDYRELVKHLFEVHKYKVLEAGNGEEALPIIAGARPDLVLVDYNMPKMNGYELVQAIRSDPETHYMKIIMFTGATNRQHLRSLNMDISDFLEKPVSNAKLLESAARALGKLKTEPKPPAPSGQEQAGQQPAQSRLPRQEMPIEPQPGAIEIERFEIERAQGTAMPEQAPQETVPVELPAEMLRQQAEEPEQAPEPPPEAAPEEEVPEVEEVFSDQDTQELELIDAGEEKKKEAALDAASLESIGKDSPLVQMVNKILMRAADLKASDIHIEPQENKLAVRVRVDGVLKLLATLPIAVQSRLTARIKIMSNLVITERRLPQDGQFRVNIKGQKIEFRVSTLPCIRGEKIVMRILGQSKLNANLESMNMTDRDRKCVEAVLNSPHGLILVTGPTGSGKTTTLYTMINVLNKPDVNIMTAEDPVEYEVPNINQVKIRPDVGLTFESTLRAFLRQDPDIMLVGEIRDLETAEIAIKASITGHLVFSTLHTNSAPATVLRLTHMGVAPYLVAASVKMVIAQRLVRKLCTRCRVQGELSQSEAKFLAPDELEKLKNVWLPGGCPHCHQTGYAGRKPLFEVMPLDSSAMRQMITSSYSVDMLADLAAKEGMTTLRQAGLAAVADGTTSMMEALKIMMG
jgi:type IV pilus assembly protein PilB